MATNYIIKQILDPQVAQELVARVQILTENKPSQWGRMNATQMLAHCSLSFVSTLDDELQPPEKMANKLAGWVFKKIMIKSPKPFRKNMPTLDRFTVDTHGSFEEEKQRLIGLILRFSINAHTMEGKAHDMMGVLTQHEWNALMYKHIDHHLRQFDV